MASYGVNAPNKKLTVHKKRCHHVPTTKLQACGCGTTSSNHQWWCEQHITKDAVDRFMNHRFWAIVICDGCF